jgi:D-methionine transport system substrate-binding protein
MRWFFVFCVAFALVACSKPNPNTLVIGTIAGPESELVETAAQVAQKKFGLNIKVVEFSDYNLPNEALNDGSLDINIFQHQPYLDAAIKAKGYKLQTIGKTFIYPSGIYSKKHQAISDFPDRAIIAIPNDPSNEIRALKLLENSGLIQLNKTLSHATVDDIEKNPKNLVFKEMDAAQLPRALDDVDAAVINTNFAIPAGLSPSRDALFLEDKNSPYMNIMVARENSDKADKLKQFVQAFQSEAVLKKAQTIYGADAIAGWKAKASKPQN